MSCHSTPLIKAPEGLAVSAVYYANLAAAELKIDGHMSEAVMACRCVCAAKLGACAHGLLLHGALP